MPYRDAVYVAGQDDWRIGFSATRAGVEPKNWSLVSTGAGMTVNQSNSNLNIATGVNTNAETIVRSARPFMESVRAIWQLILSQRIVNQAFYVELVDVVGDNLAFTNPSATSVVVTFPAGTNPFTADNVGQGMNLGAITTVAGVPGRYTIASVAGDTVTFTVAGWPGVGGAGTLSLFGWNFHRVEYNGATATSANYDTQRYGWNSGNTAASTNTTAAPGHMGILGSDDGVAYFADQIVASNAGMQLSMRASRVINIPDPQIPLYLQIRAMNGSVAPASTTTLNVSMVQVSQYVGQGVSIENIKPQPYQAALPVVVNGGSVSQGGSVSGSTTPGWFVRPDAVLAADIASAALTVTTTTGAITPVTNGPHASEFNIIVTAVTGTSPTLDVDIEESDDTGTNWYKVYSFPRIIATGAYRTPLLQLSGNRIRYVQTVGGTTPSFTRSVNRLPAPFLTAPNNVRQLIDRAIDVNTQGSATAALPNSTGATNVAIHVAHGAATAPAVFQLQGSFDGSTWYAYGNTIAPAAGSWAIGMVTAPFHFYRVYVQTAGTGGTVGGTVITLRTY